MEISGIGNFQPRIASVITAKSLSLKSFSNSFNVNWTNVFSVSKMTIGGQWGNLGHFDHLRPFWISDFKSSIRSFAKSSYKKQVGSEKSRFQFSGNNAIYKSKSGGLTKLLSSKSVLTDSLGPCQCWESAILNLCESLRK